MIVDLGRQQASAQWFPHERSPAGTHDRRRCLAQLLLELVEATEIPLQAVGQFLLGPAARLRCEILPEERVQDVSREVEGQRLLKRGEASEVALVARLVQVLEG